jgi:LuxR family maltose regulon positive regulatory protein
MQIAKQSGFDSAGLWGTYALGCCALQKLDLEAAKRFLDAIIANRYTHHLWWAISGMAGLALTFQLMQRPDQSDETAQKIQWYAEPFGKSQISAILASLQARIALLRGHSESAVRLLPSISDVPDPSQMLFFLEIPAITRNRILIADGSSDALKEADSRLTNLWESTRAIHNVFQMIEIGVLRSLVRQKLSQTDAALDFLSQTIDLAKPGGWIRPFVEAGPSIFDLLKQMEKDTGSNDQIQKILAAFAGSVSGSGQG